MAKNQATSEWFKRMETIFKNARQALIEQGVIEAGVAPSYYIEGVLYNVPNEKFGTSYEDSMVNAINWLNQADKSRFICANRQCKLLDGNADVTWNAKNCNAFSSGLRWAMEGLVACKQRFGFLSRAGRSGWLRFVSPVAVTSPRKGDTCGARGSGFIGRLCSGWEDAGFGAARRAR